MKKINDNKLLIIYNLLNDTLVILLFAWAVFLSMENLLPGFISNQLSFLKLTLFALLLIVIISSLGKKLNLSFPKEKIKKWPLIIAILFFIFNITIVLYKFNWLQIIIITLVSFLILFYFYKLFFISNNN